MIATAHATVTDTAAVVDAVRDAIATRMPIRIAGAGEWLDAGDAVTASRTLSLAPLSGIVEYVPGNLTLTARAGTTLADIAAATAEHGQWLPLDPPGSPRGTIGATVATASAGPLAHAFGPPRDLVLGIECVTGHGAIVRGGGRVTKNVAGFDLPRLFTGSWGTLGVLTDVTVRLRARPLVDTTIALRVPTDQQGLADRLRTVRAAAIEPLALEVVSPAIAGALGLGDEGALLVRLGGNTDGVRGQRAVLERLGGAREVAATIWDALRGLEPARSSTWRMSDLPSRIAETWTRAAQILGPGAWMHASVGRGIVRCIDRSDRLAASAATMTNRGAHSELTGTIIAERVPRGTALPGSADPARDRISQRIRDAFDPHRLLNPGILGEEPR